jgi:hypothetical protein
MKSIDVVNVFICTAIGAGLMATWGLAVLGILVLTGAVSCS